MHDLYLKIVLAFHILGPAVHPLLETTYVFKFAVDITHRYLSNAAFLKLLASKILRLLRCSMEDVIVNVKV